MMSRGIPTLLLLQITLAIVDSSGDAAENDHEPPCSEPQPERALRKCLDQESDDLDDRVPFAKRVRRVDRGEVADIAIYRVIRQPRSVTDLYLARRLPTGLWTVLAQFACGCNNAHCDEAYTVRDVRERSVGGARVVEVEYQQRGEYVVIGEDDSGEMDLRTRHSFLFAVERAPATPHPVDVQTVCEQSGDELAGKRIRRGRHRSSAAFSVSEEGIVRTAKSDGDGRGECRIRSPSQSLWGSKTSAH